MCAMIRDLSRVSLGASEGGVAAGAALHGLSSHTTQRDGWPGAGLPHIDWVEHLTIGGMTMHPLGRRTTAKGWARLAMKCGLLLTDPKLWTNVEEQLSEHADDLSTLMKRRYKDAAGRVDDVGDAVRKTYEDATDRLQGVGDALRGRSHWAAPTAAFIGGIGVGVGLGLLFAPVPGDEARAALRERAVDVSGRLGAVANSRFRSQSAHSPSTGTEGD